MAYSFGGMASTGATLKRIWMKFGVGIERTVYRDDHKRLDRAYCVPDPWNLNSTREQVRYLLMNEFIRRHCGPVRTVLEIGSGEGHHTRYLLKLAKEVTGLEVSARAIARARQRYPTATFVEAAFPPAPEGMGAPFDVVVAAEVLYYMRDLDQAIEAMSRCGRWCVATCYEQEIEKFDAHLLNLPNAVLEDATCEGMRYRMYLWRAIAQGS